MFTKQDMEEYLEAVLATEEKAFRFTDELISRLADEEVKKEIERIRDSEARHISTCRSLLKSLSE